MRSPRFGSILVLALFFIGGSISAADEPSALERLVTAFDGYCGSFDTDSPKVCDPANETSSDRAYLVLEEACRATAAPSSCEPPLGYCEEFRCAHTSKNAERLQPLVIALNHRTGRWTERNGLVGALEGRLKMDVAGQPTVSLAGEERIVVVVEDTNPLLYSAIPGKPTEEDVPELADIQALLGAIGGNLAGALKVVAADAAPMEAAIEGRPPFEAYRMSVEKALKDLQPAALAAECRTGQTIVQTHRAVGFVQALEFGDDGGYRPRPPLPESCTRGCDCRCLSDDPTAKKPGDCPARCWPTQSLEYQGVRRAFDDLQAKTFKPQDRPEDCVKLLDAALDVLKADTTNPVKVLEAVDASREVLRGFCTDFEALQEELEAPIGSVEKAARDAVDEARELAALASKLKTLADLGGLSPDAKKKLQKGVADQKTVADAAGEAVRTTMKDLEERFRDALRELSSQGKRLEAIRKSAEQVLTKRGEVEKAAAQVAAFEARIDRYRLQPFSDCDGEVCVQRDDLDSRIILEPQLKKVRSTKIQKHTLKVKTDSAYGDKVVGVRPAELDASYSLDSVLRGLWGISASVIYTELANPTFGAVTSEDDSMQMVIAQTDEETRAGEIALLADFRLARWLKCRGEYSTCGPKWNWFGVELGAGIGDDPAFFGGVSLRPSRSWRIGVGYTYQQVKELDNQKFGQVVASGDDIRTKDDFEGALYVSLSFALDSLSLFSAGE